MTDLTLKNVSRFYGLKAAVEQLDLTVNDGEFLSLLGPSGCGKSTTLAMIAGLDRPTGGEIWVGETLVGRGQDGFMIPHEKRGLGLVPQSYALWPHMTVAGNVGFPLKLRHVGRKERDELVAKALALVEIDTLGERYPHELSGGQQQRVAIARTLVYKPKVLLLDEPLSNLDAKLRDRARQWLRTLQRDLGMTTIFVTHDQSEALSMSDRVAVMDSGRLAQIGSPQDIYSRPETPFVADFVGTCSFLKGIVAGHENGSPVVTIEGYGTLRLPPQRQPFAVGETVSVVLRPEWMGIVQNSDARAFKVTVNGLDFVGSKYVHLATLGGQTIRFESPAPMSGEVWLKADPDRLVAFSRR